MRLLLAEDEQSLSKALVAILEGNHYSVDAVYDGVDAASLSYPQTISKNRSAGIRLEGERRSISSI